MVAEGDGEQSERPGTGPVMMGSVWVEGGDDGAVQPVSELRGVSSSHATAVACEGIECCPVGAESLVLTEGDDVYADTTEDVCIKTLDGDDSVHDEGLATTIIAGGGDDVVTSTGARLIAAGEGNDDIDVAIAGGEVNGGPGDDTIFTREGHHIVVPGPGRDSLVAGPGPVVLQVLDACELEAGESFSAAGDDDVLVLPVELSAAAALGITFAGFERVVVTGATCLSTCAPADCTVGEVGS